MDFQNKNNYKMFATRGIIEYTSRKWWIKVIADSSIGLYYRHLIYIGSGFKIQRPKWLDHISIVRNEEPENKELWYKYLGQEIEFFCDTTLKTDGLFYWLDIECPELLAIREELGLSKKPLCNFHLTVGNAKNLKINDRIKLHKFFNIVGD